MPSQTLFQCGFEPCKRLSDATKHVQNRKVTALAESTSHLYKKSPAPKKERWFDRETLKDPSSHITNSDAYKRAFHLVSAASGHQQSCGGRNHAVLSAWAKTRTGKLRWQAPDAETNIFKNLTFYLNGYCGDKEGNMELEKLIHLNGGRVVKAYSKTRISHVVTTSGLSGSKIEKEIQAKKNTSQIVHPDWVLDSISNGKRVAESDYPALTYEAQPQLKQVLKTSNSKAVPSAQPERAILNAEADWQWIEKEESRRACKRDQEIPSAQPTASKPRHK